MTTTDLQKPEREFIDMGAGYRVQTRGGGSTFRILGPDRPYAIVTSEFDHPFYTTMARAIKAERDTLAARVIELEAENARLREGLYPELTDTEVEDALTSEGIGTWGPDGERFERMFAVVMKARAALEDKP